MAAERGGKYLHLNARSIPPFRCFFSRDPLLRLAISTPSGSRAGGLRHDRSRQPASRSPRPRNAAAPAWFAAGLGRPRPGHARGIVAGRDREATRRPATSSWSSRGIHHEAGDLVGRETISDLVSPSISHDAISGS